MSKKMDVYIINSAFPLILALDKIKIIDNTNEYKLIFLKNNTHQKIEDYLVENFNKKNIFFFKNTYLGQAKLLIFSFYLSIIYKINNLYIGTIEQTTLSLIFNFLKSNKKIILSDGAHCIRTYWSGRNFESINKKNFYKIKLNVLSIFNANEKYCNSELSRLDFYRKNKYILNKKSLLILGGRYHLYKSESQIYSNLDKIIEYHNKNFKIKKIIYHPHPYELKSKVLKAIIKKNPNFIINENNSLLPIELIYKKSDLFPMYISSDNLIPSTSFYSLSLVNSSIVCSILDVHKNMFSNLTRAEDYLDIFNYIRSNKNKFNIIRVEKE